jgi:hypothetical protein
MKGKITPLALAAWPAGVKLRVFLALFPNAFAMLG